MKEVKDKEALKEALKQKSEKILVTGDFGKKLIKEIGDEKKRKDKKLNHNLLKATIVTVLVTTSGPIGWALVGGTSLATYMTRDLYKKYTIEVNQDTILFTLKKK